MPDDVEVVVVHSGQERALADVGLRRATRRSCEAAEAIDRPAARRRASPTSTPSTTPSCGAGPATSSPRTPGCAAFADALARRRPGRRPARSWPTAHASLRDDFEALDARRRRAGRPARRPRRACTAPASPAAASAAASSPSPSRARPAEGWAVGHRGAVRPSAGARELSGPCAYGVATAGVSRRRVPRPAGPNVQPAVRAPHQKRSWPSTSTTGATARARRTWRSPNGYGSLGASTRSGRAAAASARSISG